MKSSLWAWSLFSLAIVPSLATDVYKREEAAPQDESPSTTFNGIDVPPEVDLNPDNFKTTIGDGYWYALYYQIDCSCSC
jgi:protein disulfide-isomerase